MTNGEKIKEIFPSIELYEKSHDAIQINFDSVWWNAEYKEPTTKNDLGVDCISREQALVAIRNLYPSMPRVDFNGSLRKWVDKYKPYIECDDAIEQLSLVTPQEPRWISVGEKLPEPNATDGLTARYYLIQNEYWDMLVARYDGIGWKQMYQHEYLEDDVIAWMPLPTLYEPQESEG